MFTSILIFSLIGMSFGADNNSTTTTIAALGVEDLSKIKWDHAVNSKGLLKNALSNDKEMIEADVILGNLKNSTSTKKEVVMGHNPGEDSDLALKEFLIAIVEHNNANPNRKGVKLDFKQTEAFHKTMMDKVLLNKSESGLREDFNFPLWLNADILRGPGNSTNDTVNLLGVFVPKGVADNVTWSLGWTTGDYNPNNTNAYTDTNINEMLMDTKNVSNITFPVRAMYAAESNTQMMKLLEKGTLTIWSAINDTKHVNVTNLCDLINAHKNEIYVDVPDDLAELIKANGAEIINATNTLLLLATLFFHLMVTKIL